MTWMQMIFLLTNIQTFIDYDSWTEKKLNLAPIVHNQYECADLIQTDTKIVLILWDRDINNNLVAKYRNEVYINDRRAFTYHYPCVNNDNTISFYDESSPYAPDSGPIFYMGTFREILIKKDIRLYFVHSDKLNQTLLRQVDSFFPPINNKILILNKEQMEFYRVTEYFN